MKRCLIVLLIGLIYPVFAQEKQTYSETGLFLCEDKGRKYVYQKENCRRGYGGGIPLSKDVLEHYIKWQPSESFFILPDEAKIQPVCDFYWGVTCVCRDIKFSPTNNRQSLPMVLLRVLEDQRSLRSIENRINRLKVESDGNAPVKLIESYEDQLCRHVAYTQSFKTDYQSALDELLIEYRSNLETHRNLNIEYDNCKKLLSNELAQYLDAGNFVIKDKDWISELKSQESCQRDLKKAIKSSRKESFVYRRLVANWLTYAMNFPDQLNFEPGQEYRSQLNGL